MIEIIPLSSIGEVVPGDTLASLLVAALTAEAISLEASDILVISQKIVSKAENRFVDLRRVVPGAKALSLAEQTGKDPRLVELIVSESTAILRAAPRVLITRHRSGHVMANAGIDQSNLGRHGLDWVLLLPLDADHSAERIRAELGAQLALAPAIVIADSFGRPWRQGVVNVAIGASGLPALIDKRGQPDRDGRVLEVTQIALADIVACAAGLALGEAAEGVPAAIVRGVGWQAPGRPASALVRPLEEDLFQ